jgi:uncharacterized protein YdaU (DUF1376 family)
MKIRRIDFSPDEFIAGTMELSDAECGLYWRLCSLIYSRGRGVSRDELRAVSPSHGNAFNALLRRLIEIGKVIGNDADLIVKRCANELETARKRSAKWRENGAKGGRPPSNISNMQEPSGFSPRARPHIHQPSTTNKKESTLAGAKEKAPRRRSQIPENWIPDDAGRSYALHHAGWADDRMDREIEHFRNHHRQKGAVFADHAAAWRTWVQRGAKIQEQNANGRPKLDRNTAAEHGHRRALGILAQAAIDYDERQSGCRPAETSARPAR